MRRESTTFRTLFLITALVLSAAACNEYEDPPPPPLPTVPAIPPTQFDIAGEWNGLTDQGRALRFEVRPAGSVVIGTIDLHHDYRSSSLSA